MLNRTGASQRTALFLFLFALYTSDFKHKSESFHIQKASHDMAAMACIGNGKEGEYRGLIRALSCWSDKISKTKEMDMEFWSSMPTLCPVDI